MLNTIGMVSARQLLCAALLSGVSVLVAVGCGGGDSGGPSSTAGAGGDTGDAGETGEGGNTTAGKGGKAGSSSGGSGDAGDTGDAGAAGTESPAQNHSAVSFVTAAVTSKSKNFVLVSNLGESVGATVGSKRSKSLKYTYIPGVVAASTP